MAQFRPKQGPKLPPPPAPTAAPQNLHAPESAPAAPAVDGRAARATGRTKQLATRVTEEFYDELKLYGAQHRLKLVEVLEASFEALKRQSSS
jgi:hypothetical protein